MSDFEQLNTTKLGAYAERLAVEYYEKKMGYKVLVNKDRGPHDFDNIVYVPNDKRVYILDVKAKLRRLLYMDTGFDAPDFEKYQKFAEKGIPVCIVWVDAAEKCMYTSNIVKLAEPYVDPEYSIEYPLIIYDCIYFHMSKMTRITWLKDEHIKNLLDLTHSTYDYANFIPFFKNYEK